VSKPRLCLLGSSTATAVGTTSAARVETATGRHTPTATRSAATEGLEWLLGTDSALFNVKIEVVDAMRVAGNGVLEGCGSLKVDESTVLHI
jgi:hypothetical protein